MSLGPCNGWNAMLLNCMLVDIFLKMSLEKAEICLWIYIRKVSLDHRPIFLIALPLIPFRCIAIAPPALRLWLPTWSLCNPCCSRPRYSVDCLTAVLISVVVVMHRPFGYFLLKYVLKIVFGLVVYWSMCFTRQMIALMGQLNVFMASWWIVCERTPFFWLEILSVAAVQCTSKYSVGSAGDSSVLWCHNDTSWSRNCLVRRFSNGLWYVYSPTRRR